MGASEKAAATYHPGRRPSVLDDLPAGSVVMTRILPGYGFEEQRVWQRFAGAEDWQVGTRRHDWQSTDGGFVQVGHPTEVIEMGPRRVTVLHRPDRAMVDATELLAAMRERMTDAEQRRYDPGESRVVCDATADAFGTVIDWFEDVYLPGLSS